MINYTIRKQFENNSKTIRKQFEPIRCPDPGNNSETIRNDSEKFGTQTPETSRKQFGNNSKQFGTIRINSGPRPRKQFETIQHPSSMQSLVPFRKLRSLQSLQFPSVTSFPFSHFLSLQSAPFVGSLAHESVLKKASIRHFM